MSAARERAREVVERWLAEAAAEEVDGPHGPARVEHEVGARPGEYVVQLPGERKLRTGVSLLLGDHSLSVSAFVVRNPDEEHARVHRWLLERNARLRQVAFALDRDGDVYLRGRLPLDGVTGATLDSLLGEVLEVADSSFDELLALGFLTSMRKEWAWRTSRGESTRNLEAFRHLLDDGAGSQGAGSQGAGSQGSGPQG